MIRAFPRRAFLAISALGIAALFLAQETFTSSIAFIDITFEKAMEKSSRIVIGKITGTSVFKFEGAEFHAIGVKVEKILKGDSLRVGDALQLFSPAEWFRHSHAAAIQGGVISYADPHYRTTPPGALKPGKKLIFFLGEEAPPQGFPKKSVFLYCAGSYDLAKREKDWVQTITLKVGDSTVLRDGLRITLAGHSHKRPMVDGPRRETSEVRVTLGAKSELIYLGHISEPETADSDARETWEKRVWEGYEFELVAMKYDEETTLRARKAGATAP